ncbi:MAG: response regulator [Alphaproteobacteria bacterium]|nr:response regulator [Alphaproteobacteria bacterium]
MTPRRLLVCDDEPDIRTLVRDVAEAMGYVVEEVSDSRKCAARASTFAPDVVVLDIVMPDVDGIEVVRGLAELAFRGRILLISGFNPSYARAADMLARSRGLFDIRVLSKPLPLAELRAALSP